MFAVIFFSTFSHCYNQELYNDCLQILKYLVNTKHAKLVFRKSNHENFTIKILCDASYGEFPVGCALVYVNDCLIHVVCERSKAAKGRTEYPI